MNGSPPFRRATRWPAPASSTQQRVDALLLAALPGLLADKDAARIAARAIEHRLAHQAVIEDDVRLLQQLQRPQRQQVRIAGPGADQIHLTERSSPLRRRGRGELRGAQLASHSLRGGGSSPRSTSLATGPRTMRSQKARRAALRQCALHGLSLAAHEARQRTQARR